MQCVGIIPIRMDTVSVQTISVRRNVQCHVTTTVGCQLIIEEVLRTQELIESLLSWGPGSDPTERWQS